MTVIKNKELLDELAKSQNVHSQSDIKTLFGTWPGDPEDGFEDMVHKHRKQNISMRATNDR